MASLDDWLGRFAEFGASALFESIWPSFRARSASQPRCLEFQDSLRSTNVEASGRRGEGAVQVRCKGVLNMKAI